MRYSGGMPLAVIKSRNSVTAGEESGGVLLRKASDQTEVSTMTLISAGVAACSRSLRNNQWYQRCLIL
ncbi:hypothetical protein Mic7113_6156 [Allocoleopsis franciscana PCC 7113]|uniref:Uncharacterized protein n=1 Tax=Allocoleopsis franciscana PCC 7113 TaxID=1173027 RepID=K9WNI5_9CYAN|nr:hypothetical protein Mic7113_6156 [Allocoleopsis franciscana PCC 7113]